MNNDKNHQNLERDIHRILRAQPDRAAPASLESRVFAEIARRAALPWWKQSFNRWPLAIRIVFTVISAAIATAMVMTLARVLNLLPGRISSLSTNSLVMTARGYWNMASGYIAYRLADIPSYVFTIAAVVIAACYATLFGFGAAAYRYLWKAR